jgi:hypothetical protein
VPPSACRRRFCGLLFSFGYDLRPRRPLISNVCAHHRARDSGSDFEQQCERPPLEF